MCPEQIKDASDRLKRFAPYLKTVFPELEKTDGIIESELREIGHMKEFLNLEYHAGIEGKLMLKMDSDLPVSGSVKARGGIYEVLKHAEDLALEAGMLKEDDDYSILAGKEFQEFFRQTYRPGGKHGKSGDEHRHHERKAGLPCDRTHVGGCETVEEGSAAQQRR